MILHTSVLLAAFLHLPISAPLRQAPAPAATPAQAGSAGQSASSSESSAAPSKGKLIPSYLILGTVFNEHALSFPGVRVRIRLAGGKKVLQETYTNSRGEFAVRVPPGFEYEVEMHVKKYQDHTESVDSKVDVQQRLSVKLVPISQTKAAAKP